MFQLIKILLKTKFELYKPKQKNILIFDNTGADTPYYRYLKKKDCEILFVKGEKINLYVIFVLILKFKKITLGEYINQYIELHKPKFIFHNSYNYRFFLLNKKNFTFEFTKVFTQSELKNEKEHNNFINKRKNLQSDYMFVWNKGMKNLMEKNIEGKYIVNGAFLNNEGPLIKSDKLKRKISFISQFRTFRKNYFGNYGYKYTYEQFYKADIELAILLKNFCIKNNLELEIIGSSINDKENEKNFFKNKLGSNGWKFVESSPEKRGIYLTAESKFIVTIDSTLGYECLARGQRVCFFSNRSKYLNIKDYFRFGWPLNLPEEGKCWTTSNSKINFDRLTNFLVNADDTEWKKILENELKDLVFYNEGNLIFKNFLLKNNLLNENIK